MTRKAFIQQKLCLVKMFSSQLTHHLISMQAWDLAGLDFLRRSMVELNYKR